MNKIIMNERAYIDKLKKLGNLGENVGYAVSLLSKFYRSEGCDINEIKHRLEEDVCKYEPSLKAQQREFYIVNALKNIDRSKLVNVNEILVTRTEMDRIINITSDNKAFRASSLRRLAFTLLCFEKFEAARGRGECPWINCQLNVVYKAAKLTGRSQSQNNLYLHELYDKGLVQFAPRKNGVGVKVTFMDNDGCGETAVRVRDINYAGDRFLEYCGRKYIECKVCGKPVPKTSRNLLYCRDCAVIANREKTRSRMAEARKK